MDNAIQSKFIIQLLWGNIGLGNGLLAIWCQGILRINIQWLNVKEM